jgi:hypothetical protein
MADFGELPFISAAVQVIPVLAVLVVADAFIQRDAADPVHRIFASTAVAIGLAWGIVGEIAGLQALLTGPTRQTIPLLSGGMMALGASALVPRLVELHVPRYPDVARRIAQRLIPAIIGTVGLVFATTRYPLGYRVGLYGQRSRLRRLQSPQDGRRFARQCGPPLTSGFTWSQCSGLLPHIQQRQPQ